MSDLNLTVNEGSGVYLAITETPAVVTLGAAVISGALSSTVTVANTVTVALDANSLSALENVTVTVGAAVSISNFPSSQVVSVSNFPNSSSVTIANFPSVTTVTGTVALDSASLLALENITVTVGSSVALAAGSAQIGSVTVANFPATQTVQGTVTVGSLPLVSGSVTVNNFPSTQTVQGTVTANTGLSQPLTDTQLRASSVTVGIASLPASTVTVSSLPSISGTVTAVLSANTNFNDGGDRLNVGLGAVAGIDPANWLKVDGGSVPVSGTVTANVPAATSIDNQLPYLYGNNTDDPKQTAVPIGFNDTNDDKFYNVSDVHPLPISGAVTANASNLPVYNPGDTIFDDGLVGVTGKVFVGNDYDGNDGEILIGKPAQEFIGGQGRVGVELINKSGVSLVVTGPALNTWVSNTVTANVAGTINANIRDGSGNNLTSTSIGGLNRLNVTLSSAGSTGTTAPAVANLYGGTDGTNLRAISVDSSGRSVVTVANFPATQAVSLASTTVTVSSLPASTVTVSALPSGALTTRFGSVTTANTAQLTAAVTNSARRYLLAQNISAGTVTIGIGFSPTTTQGIQLTSGAGLTFDAFCPTGAVFWLGAVTGAAFTILEG